MRGRKESWKVPFRVFLPRSVFLSCFFNKHSFQRPFLHVLPRQAVTAEEQPSCQSGAFPSGRALPAPPSDSRGIGHVRPRPSPRSGTPQGPATTRPDPWEGRFDVPARKRRGTGKGQDPLPSQKETTPRPGPARPRSPLTSRPRQRDGGLRGGGRASTAPGCHGNRTPTIAEPALSRRRPRRAPAPPNAALRRVQGRGGGRRGLGRSAPAQSRNGGCGASTRSPQRPQGRRLLGLASGRGSSGQAPDEPIGLSWGGGLGVAF